MMDYDITKIVSKLDNFLHCSSSHFGDGKLKSLGKFDSEMEAFLSYKDHKEKYIKKLADKWRHKLDIRVYDSLMNWNISFDD